MNWRPPSRTQEFHDHTGQRRPREVIELFHRAMIALSADDLADLHAVDAVYEFPLLTPGRPDRYQGREEIRRGFASVWAEARTGLQVTDVRNVVLHVTVDPEVFVVEQEAAAVLLGRGERILAPSLLVFRIQNGLVAHVRDYSSGARRADDSVPL